MISHVLLFGLDDTPTKRYGPKVEGAGIHHNPTPDPADQKFLYGHVWVTLAWLVRHPLGGAIGLPLRAWLYVRRRDVGKLPRWYRMPFRGRRSAVFSRRANMNVESLPTIAMYVIAGIALSAGFFAFGTGAETSPWAVMFVKRRKRRRGS